MEKRIDLLRQGAFYLKGRKIVNSLQESEMFLAHILNCPRTELYLNNFIVQSESMRNYWNLLSQRAEGFPLQYLIGSSGFMGLEFKVAQGVFIPRPETEILIETVLQLSAKNLMLPAKVLDIGTGCGNIAVSLAKNLDQANVFACDISDFALQLAKENSQLNAVTVRLVKSDLFRAFKKENTFSLIVSNPPYIKTEEILSLGRELRYEPMAALDGGEDGLCYYKRIINEEAPCYLQKSGFLVLEIGDNQAQAVKTILSQSRRLSVISIVKDYNNLDRVIVAKKQK